MTKIIPSKYLRCLECLVRQSHETHKYAYTTSRLGYVVAQLVEALRYKPEGHGFDSRWGHGDFSVT
jgi:hypothetical protein